MSIDFDKSVRTINGLDVKIYSYKNNYNNCIHGAIRLSDGWQINTWDEEGKSGCSVYCLENVPIKVVRYINIYPDSVKFDGSTKRSRYAADNVADKLRRISCIKIEVEEGRYDK